MKKIITGVKPTGSSMHLGNLMGAVLPFGNVAKGNDAAIFIADLHALTSVKDGAKLRDQSHELAIEYMSIYGLDTPITIFRQSDITNITKLMWILTNVTPYSLMLRAHSFKDVSQKQDDLLRELIVYGDELIKTGDNFNNKRIKLNEARDLLLNINDDNLLKKLTNEQLKSVRNSVEIYKASNDLLISEGRRIREAINEYKNLLEKGTGMLNMGVFNYPILMAADIIGYDIDAVPVGKDQIQHLEMTRDIARAFNKTYGVEVFTEPEAIIEQSVATLPGIDGRKMSKSYDNFIGIFDDEKTMKKRVMSITTGSEGIDEKKKNPDECNVFNLYRVFATPEQTAALRVKYESEGIGFGYGHAKTELLTVLMEYLRPYREARVKLLEHPEIVEAKLAEGAKIMNARLDAKMKVVKEVVGVN